MSDDASPPPLDLRATARSLGLYALLACLPAVGLFLFSADLFDAFHGVAGCHRPISRAEGMGDRLRRFVLVRSGQEDMEVRLPAAAFAHFQLPECPSGVPPRVLPEAAPTVHKDTFRMHFTVDEVPWPTPWPGDLVPPLVLLLAGLPFWNWWTTGSPFRLVGRDTPAPRLGEGGGRPPAPRPSGGYGPPPGPRRRGRSRR